MADAGLVLGRLRRFVLFMSIFKGLMGVALFVCGIMGVSNMQDQETWGPPYYIGAFVVGSCITLAAVFATCLYCRTLNVDPEQDLAKNKLGSFLTPYFGFTIFALFCCSFGFFFASWGVKGCEYPHTFANGCNYNENIDTNKRVATIIVILLVLTVISGLATVYFVCCYPGMKDIRSKMGRRHRRGVVVINTSNQNVYHYPGATTGAYPFSGATASDEHNVMRNLEEENRLLREQLELRQRLAEGQPKPQQQGAMYYPAAPPPSYNDVIPPQPESDPQFEKAPYPNDSHEPSAPPMLSSDRPGVISSSLIR